MRELDSTYGDIQGELRDLHAEMERELCTHVTDEFPAVTQASDAVVIPQHLVLSHTHTLDQAQLDIAMGLANAAIDFDWQRPQITEERQILIDQVMDFRNSLAMKLSSTVCAGSSSTRRHSIGPAVHSQWYVLSRAFKASLICVQTPHLRTIVD